MTRKYLFSLSLLALVISAAALQPIVSYYQAKPQAQPVITQQTHGYLLLPNGTTLARSSKFSAQPFAALHNNVYGLAARANDGVSAPAGRPNVISRSWGSIKLMFL
ncbi:hypothetical protein [Solirubrum puertoriconensis]|uniref:Uncharacterized protein n=1 Tax=Solirubrum puertoriconensis TaxID=1751427 RepID=A0A9X0HIN3_SOLP1|nr:hypothetical protein [Solirubrum puertoriconensis]KUG06600.1 hypothetical protein ASU33_04450 [Solirubrum puertoriconensis]